MKTTPPLIAVALALLLAPAACKPRAAPRRLTIYCAAGLRDPMADMIAAFEADHAPAAIRADYGGSGELLGRLKTASEPEYRPDLFLAGEESYARQAMELGLIDRYETLAYFVPVIAVAKGNPRNIRSLADIARPGVAVALGDSRGTAVGKVTDQVLHDAGLMPIRQNAGGSFTTVQAVATQVAFGNADAAIIWDATARQGDFAAKLDVVPIADAPRIRIVICRVAQGPHPELADGFIRFATTAGVARESLRKHGFTVQPPAPAAPGSTTQPAP